MPGSSTDGPPAEKDFDIHMSDVEEALMAGGFALQRTCVVGSDMGAC